MTLQTATRLGMIGMAMPFAAIVGEIVLATIVGIPARMITENWPLPTLLTATVPALIVLLFLYVLYRAARGRTTPARLSDAAMAAAILFIAFLAMNLRWSVFSQPLVRYWSGGAGWMQAGDWLTENVLEPFAWLAFLLTFVRLPETPPRPASRRAALVLGSIIGIGGVLAGARIGIQYIVSMGVPRMGFSAWTEILAGVMTILRYVLLAIFAIATWRTRPKVVNP